MKLDLPYLQSLDVGNDAEGWAALNDIFRRASRPELPAGRYNGSLIAVRIVPGITQLVRYLADSWLPWIGKQFHLPDQSGDNIFTRDSLRLARVIWPRYSGYRRDTATTYRAFRFQTRMDHGLFDPDRQVLVLDYCLPGNPPTNVKRVRDELVQLEDGTYLGKAHFRWYRNRWQTVAYFSLQHREGQSSD